MSSRGETLAFKPGRCPGPPRARDRSGQMSSHKRVSGSPFERLGDSGHRGEMVLGSFDVI